MIQEIKNPADGASIRQVEYSSKKEIASIVQKSTEAQRAWKDIPFSERQEIISKFATKLDANKQEIAKIQATETGKPISQATGEANASIPRIRYLCKEAEKFYRPEIYSQKSSGNSHDEFITYDPLGTVLNISAWNYPLFVSINVVVPALLTGNTVVFKPSEFAIGTGEKMVELLHESGVPENVLQVVLGAREEGESLLNHKFDGVFFTGSYNTGKTILSNTRDHLIRVGLELGGKDPAQHDVIRLYALRTGCCFECLSQQAQGLQGSDVVGQLHTGFE